MSSSSTPRDGQREDTRLQQDTRPRTFLGTIKNIFTASFAWLMAIDDYDDYEERDGPGKRKRTATPPVETKEEKEKEKEEEEEEEEEEIQYLGRKSPEPKRRKCEPASGRSIRENDPWFARFEAPRELPSLFPRPGPDSLDIHKPTEWYSVCFGPELPPVGIVRSIDRGEDVPESGDTDCSSSCDGSCDGSEEDSVTPTPTPAIPLATRVTSAIPSITRVTSAIPSIARVTSAISSVTRATPAIPSVTPAAPVIPKRPSPLPLVPDLPGFAKSEIYQLYMKLTAHLKEPDWIDMISMEFLKGHPAFTQPPPDRHKVPLWDSVRNPSLGELLASEQGEEWHEYLQKVWREKTDRENKKMEEARRQRQILKAQAKAKEEAQARLKASQRPKRPSRAADLYRRLEGYRPSSPPKERTSSQPGLGLLFQPYHKLLPYSDEAPDWNPGGKKLHPMFRYRANPGPGRRYFKKLLGQDYYEEVQETEGQIEEAIRKVQRDASVQASEIPSPTSEIPSPTSEIPSPTSEIPSQTSEIPSPTSMSNGATEVANVQSSTLVTEAVEAQPSISVPNDVISEAAETQPSVSMPHHATAEVTNTRPPPSSPEDVSMESVRSDESDGRGSPMSVDVSMESAGNVLLSPSISKGVPPPPIQNDCFSVASGPLSMPGASSLRVGHMKSSRNHIPRPAIRSRAKSPAEGNGLMLDRDEERAMLEEAAKNVPAFNLPANFSFTKNPTEPLSSGVPPAQEMQSTISSIPNFFASSPAFQKPLEIKTPPSMFGAQAIEFSKKSTAFVSNPNPAPLHVASSTSSSRIPFGYSTPSASLNARGHANPPVPIEDPENPLWDGEKTENAQRDQKLSLGQQVHVNNPEVQPINPSSFHAGVPGNQTQVGSLPSPKNSDEDDKMDISPPNRFTSSNFNVSNPPVINNPTSTSFFAFGANSSSNVFAAPPMTEFRSEGSQPFGQTPGRAGISYPSTPGPFSGFNPVNGTSTPNASGFNSGTHPANNFGGPASNTSFTTPGSFASGVSSIQPAPVIAGPSSFPSGVPFGTGANQFNSPNQFNPNPFNPNQFNQSHSNSFNQLDPNQFNQLNPNQFNQLDPNQLNQLNPNQFNQLDPNQFNQLDPNQFNQSNPNSFNQSNSNSFNSNSFNQPNPNLFNQPNLNQFNQLNPNSFNQPNLNQFNQPNPDLFSQPNPNLFNQPHPNSFNQPNPTLFNQPNPTSFNQPNPTSFNQSTPTSFNQSTPTSFNQSTPTSFNQSTPTSFNQSNPTSFNQSNPNQLNPSAPSSPFTIGTAPPRQQVNQHGRPMKNLPQRNRRRQ